MRDLPTPVLDYIHTLTIKNYSPAYLLVKKDGCLSSWGGKLAKYGVTNLQIGEYVEEKVCFLQGLLPLDNSPVFLPCIRTEDGLYADIHIFSGDEGDWVLLLDATLEENQRHLIQQKGNDLSLLRQKQARMLNQYFNKDITDNLAKRILTLQVRGERRNVSILLVNICGFTSYSESNPPDIVFKTLNLYLSTMIEQIVDEGGMIDKTVGDTVIAFFGILPATSSPPVQATKAAMRMIEAVKDIGKMIQENNLLTLGIGIASGPVALGIIGNKDRRTFSVVGYHVDIAMRLQNQARWSEILIDENTFNKIAYLQKYFSATALFEKEAQQIPIYSYLMQ